MVDESLREMDELLYYTTNNENSTDLLNENITLDLLLYDWLIVMVPQSLGIASVDSINILFNVSLVSD